VNITFANGAILTGEIDWNYDIFTPGYSFPQIGPTGLYLDGVPAFGACGAPNGSSLCTGFFSTVTGQSPPHGFGPHNIYAVLADLPNSLGPTDFFLDGSLDNGFTDGIPGVRGSIRCVSGNCTLNPVPLPAALPMFGAAVAGLGGAGWWKRRKDSRNLRA
jgi:hypothetical protein